MHAPGPAAWLLVALCAATSAYCLLRMRAPGRGARSTAGGEALMGLAMAVMAVPAAVLRPPAWAWVCYTVVFGAAALRALWAARAGSAHHAHHLVGTLAMVYMAWAMASTPLAARRPRRRPHVRRGAAGHGAAPRLLRGLRALHRYASRSRRRHGGARAVALDGPHRGRTGLSARDGDGHARDAAHGV
ncbi:LOW QUALITY PROTEIN: integral membrane protein, partial [Streptomyces sp. SPB78]